MEPLGKQPRAAPVTAWKALPGACVPRAPDVHRASCLRAEACWAATIQVYARPGTDQAPVASAGVIPIASLHPIIPFSDTCSDVRHFHQSIAIHVLATDKHEDVPGMQPVGPGDGCFACSTVLHNPSSKLVVKGARWLKPETDF